MKPLYIWAGGKNKMIPKYLVEPGIPGNFSTFVEPFFGGGAMTCWMSKNRPDKSFVINDVKDEIMGIYRAIKDDPNTFIDKLKSLEDKYLPMPEWRRKDFYYDLREQYYDPVWSKTEDSAILYFLMLTSFNGIWQSTQKSNGRFATPVGLLNKTKVFDEHNIKQWHYFLRNVEIRCGDWSELKYDNAFYFMDPPYRDSLIGYGEGNNDTMQKALVEFCKEEDARGNYVFLCNRKEDNFFEEIQGDLDAKYYDITYTAGRRKLEENGFSAKKAVEILLHSKSINNPSLDSFF
jgi:DNA adenine methylase